MKAERKGMAFHQMTFAGLAGTCLSAGISFNLLASGATRGVGGYKLRLIQGQFKITILEERLYVEVL